jgi:hypothetical protein
MPKLSQPRSFWLAALGISLLLSVLASLRGGYIGPDYNVHLARLIEWPKIFDFSTTSPPSYYLLGHALYRAIGNNNGFPITLSIVQAAINTVALWWFFIYTERRFSSPLAHLALVIFVSFLPVRIIHAAVIGTDCTTIPLLVLVLFLVDKFLSDTRSGNALHLGLGLTLAVGFKYSFMALLPVALGIFFWLWRKRRWSFPRLVTVCLLSLLLASTFSFYSFWASSRTHGYNTERHWLPKGMPPDMTYGDLLSVKVNDLSLFSAPEYFKREILEAHRYSYLGLLHLGLFTDTMNLFQVLSVPQRIEGILIPDQKIRHSWKTTVMRASMSLGILWTLCALIGTVWAFQGAVKDLWKDKLEREDIAVFFGMAFFLVIFLPIPFVYASVLFGYWTPRLILPSLLCFSFAAFLFIDRKLARGSTKIAFVVLLLVLAQSAIESIMLA